MHYETRNNKSERKGREMYTEERHILANYIVEPYKDDKDRFRLTNKFQKEMRRAKVRGKIEYDEVKMLIMYNYDLPAKYSN